MKSSGKELWYSDYFHLFRRRFRVLRKRIDPIPSRGEKGVYNLKNDISHRWNLVGSLNINICQIYGHLTS